MVAVIKRPPVDYSKCNQRITIYHNANGVFSQQTLYAFFDFHKNQSINKTGSTEVNGSLIVIPKSHTSGSQPIFVGDKVVLGEGATVTTREQWAAMVPSNTANMVVVKYVDPKYWQGDVAHWEAGG